MIPGVSQDDSKKTSAGIVYLIGAGPGDPGLFTLRGKELLEGCDVIVYDYLANDELLALARKGAEIIYVGKQGGDHTLAQDEINRLIVSLAREGKRVARLKGGDPYMFGRGAEEAEELLAAEIPFEVVPGVTSAIAAAAYAGIPLTHRAYASSVCFATGHEDPFKVESAHNWRALATSASSLVFFMGMKNLPDIVRNLTANGMDPETPAALVRWGTTSRHRSCVGTLKELPNLAIQYAITAPSLIIIGSVVALHDKFNWFEKKPLLGKGVVVTRSREHTSGISALLRSERAEVLEFPTISVEPLEDAAPVREAICRLCEYDWIVFTSANGIAFFWRELDALGLDARAFAATKIAVIGPATAEALAAKGLRADYIPNSFVAESALAGLVDLCVKGRKILIPRAMEGRDILPQGLVDAGAFCHVLPVYRTVPSAAGQNDVLRSIAEGGVQYITFASSSTVRTFFARIPKEAVAAVPGIRFACIGPITAATLEQIGFCCHVMPERHTVPDMVRAIVQDAAALNTSTRQG